jgi:peroxiredoxin/RNA polymerase subunit RPABC4/transcription elongation factor Spt4
MPSTICQRCQSPNDYNATVCQNCGARLCPHCHLVIDSPNASVCPKCGKKDLTFRPGKYSGSTYIGSSVSASVNPAASYCSNCGSKIEPGIKKCPYCGRLGSLVTQSPQQGYGVMKPAHGEPQPRYMSPEPEPVTQTQKICQKCGMPFPPGSSQCPKHGKYGGGSVLSESTIKLEGANLWARIEEKRAASASGEQPRMQPRRSAPPEDYYPQMNTAPAAPPDNYPPVEAEAQRTCPSCGAPVPDRSKVCPNCGNNRLPAQRSKPFTKAEAFYKARAPVEQPYDNYPPAQDPYYGQPAAQPYGPSAGQQYPPADQQWGQPAGQQYGQPALQPYEATYPVASPSFIDDLSQDRNQKKQKKEKKPKEEHYREARTGPKKSPLPILLALIALGGVIVIAVILILDQLKAPVAVVPPSSLNPPVTTQAAGVIISDIQFSDITQTGATVTWKTDKKGNSLVIYCLDGGDLCESGKDDAMVTNHSVKLTGLEKGKSYHITVKSRVGDSADSPEASKDAVSPLRLSEVRDMTPPKITEVKITNLVGSSAEITWKTDEPATSQVSYGTSATYGTLQPSSTDTTLQTFHDVSLYGLAPTTVFHFKVISRDADGNEASSPDATFATPQPAGSAIGNSAPDFTLQNADGTSVTLSSLRGSKVIINFWHLNCSPCLGEMPAFQQLHVKYPNLPILCIHGTALGPANPNAIGAFLTDRAYTMTVPIDGSGQVSSLYNISSVPKTFFIDSSGIIKKIQDGSFSGESQIEGMLTSY